MQILHQTIDIDNRQFIRPDGATVKYDELKLLADAYNRVQSMHGWPDRKFVRGPIRESWEFWHRIVASLEMELVAMEGRELTAAEKRRGKAVFRLTCKIAGETAKRTNAETVEVEDLTPVGCLF